MTTETLTIQEQTRKLAEARRALEGRKRKVLDLNKQLEEIETYQWLMESQDELNEAFRMVEEAEAELRAAVIDEHAATGEKHYPGAQVKLFVVRKYDAVDALNWCIDHDVAEALKLDKRKFDKVADAIKPKFVEFTEEPKVYIDGDLSGFLEAE